MTGLAPAGAPVQIVAPVPRILLRREEAAAALGMSVDSFERYVLSHVRAVRKGKLVLFPVSELDCWATENLSRAPARG